MVVNGGSAPVTGTSHRFAFGANWARFLRRLTPERITLAEKSLSEWLGDLRGRAFLDIGSGSGLFSLAARNLGASVRSFDYDQQSVACTAELRRRYHPDDWQWIVEQGSVLNEAYLRSLGSFDIVYSWGVLHHTGELWRAMDLATVPMCADGRMYIALYHRLPDAKHRRILRLKRAYVRGPTPVRWALVGKHWLQAGALEIATSLYHGRAPLARIQDYSRTSRGMSWWTDIVDWAGGYPYEPSTPEEVAGWAASRGLTLRKERIVGGYGCNEFLLSRCV